MLRRLWTHRELIRELALRQVRELYVGSAFGSVWALAQPFFMLVIYTLVFGLIMRIRLGAEDEGPWFFGLKLCAALLPWQVFQETLARGTTALSDHANLLRKSVFPAETIVVSIALGRAFHFCMTCILYAVLYGVLIVLDLVPNAVSPWVLFVPVVLALQIVFTVGLCWVTSCLHAYFRDIAPLVGTLTTVWFFGSPIVYNPHYLESWHSVPPLLRQLYALNPWYRFVEAYQNVMMGYAPRPVTLLMLTGWALAMFLLGTLVCRRCRDDLMDVI